MRVRKLTASGDYSFGHQQADFFVNQPDGVAQVVQTRLALWLGEWFLDTTDGTDWMGSVLGNRTAGIRDAMIRARVFATPGVQSIDGYGSSFDGDTRAFRVVFQLNTDYGLFGRFQQQYIIPALTPQPQPPAEPVNVTATALTQTEVSVSWQPYTVPTE